MDSVRMSTKGKTAFVCDLCEKGANQLLIIEQLEVCTTCSVQLLKIAYFRDGIKLKQNSN